MTPRDHQMIKRLIQELGPRGAIEAIRKDFAMGEPWIHDIQSIGGRAGVRLGEKRA